MNAEGVEDPGETVAFVDDELRVNIYAGLIIPAGTNAGPCKRLTLRRGVGHQRLALAQSQPKSS